MKDIISQICYLLYGLKEYEQKLHRYNGYRPNSIVAWKNQTAFTWPTTKKLLDKLEIFDAQRIRQVITKIVNSHQNIFNQPNCFITSFGGKGKSGEVVVYEFNHTNLIQESRFKHSWELSGLPSGSTIVFVEDLIGTGFQSADYIINKVNLIISPSHNPILLTLCATPEGINKVINETNFTVITGIKLSEDTYQHYSDQCKFFTKSEKYIIKTENQKLKNPNKKDYDRGLLISFYYSVPNNSMPIVWKDGYEYTDEKGRQKNWQALLPREF